MGQLNMGKLYTNCILSQYETVIFVNSNILVMLSKLIIFGHLEDVVSVTGNNYASR